MPRFRFTIRSLMAVVAIVAMILGVEIQWVRYAIAFVSEHGTTIRSEAIAVWAIPHAAIAFVYFAVGEIRDRRERRDADRDNCRPVRGGPAKITRQDAGQGGGDQVGEV